MFCYQCQETAQNIGCTKGGVCGKNAEVAGLQDVLIYVLKGLSLCEEKKQELGASYPEDNGPFIMKALFATVTNTNFDSQRISELIKEALRRRDDLYQMLIAGLECKGEQCSCDRPDCVTWKAKTQEEFLKKAETVGRRVRY